MPDLITRLRLQNNDFNNNLDKSKQKVSEFQDKAEDATKTLQDMSSSSTKSARELLKEMSSLENGTRSVSNYRRQLSQLTRDIQDLTINYSNMSKEMQNSDLGRETVLKINELTKEAAKYKDAIMDAQASISAMASDTANWDAVKQGMQIVSSTLQSVAAAGILSADSTEKLVAVIAKLKGIESATNAVIQIGNALQKQSAVMMGISRVQAIALTKAKIAETTATKGATVAQKLFNAVANANPYTLLATAIIAVVGALAVFSTKSNEAKEAQKKQQEQIEKTKKEFEDYKSKVGTSVGDIVAKFTTLQRSYRNLSTEMEKKKWIDENATAFNNLGLKIKSVNDADEVFNRQSEAVIEALKARARAEALVGLYQDKIKEKTLAEIDAEKELANVQKARQIYYTTNGGLPQDLKDAGFTEKDLKYVWGGDQSGSGWYELTPAQIQRLNDYYRERAKEASYGVVNEVQGSIDIIEKMITGAEKDAADAAEKVKNLLTNSTTNNGNPTNNGGEAVKALEGSKKYIEDLINKTKELIDSERVGSKEWWEANDALKSLNQQLIDLIKYERKLKYGEQFEIPVLPVILDKKLVDENGNLRLPNFDPDNPPKLAVKAEVDKLSLAEAIESISTSINRYLGVSTQFLGSINSIYDSFSKLTDRLHDSENAWEQFFAVFETGVTLVNSFVGIIQSVGEATSLLNSILGVSTAAKAADTAATQANTAAELTNAGAKSANAVAGAGSSVSSVPIVGPVLAVAAIASVLAALLAATSRVKKFANGGIVGGNSYGGDKILAGLNSGEMILNQKQQSNLFKMLNEGRTRSNTYESQTVELKVRGSDLVAVLSNYSNKRNRI